jgi:putative selenate reductase
MSDRFQPISMEQLTAWVFTELEEKDAIFGIPRRAFFEPTDNDRFKQLNYGEVLETPFGVAAGPHTQMAQNIVVSWLVGARFLELKTIQTLDELDVNKPCIDLEDEGYNVEWSQELKIHQSFDEYLRAWVLIHALHHRLGYPGDSPGMEFNMSVGYNLEGILEPNVQWYLDVMNDSSEYLDQYIDIVAEWYPAVRDIDIPAQLSNTITLSTMHGCPPDEIEAITSYLMRDRGIHTSVKCNPTLLGPTEVRSIVNDELGYTDIVIPDEAFGHDLKYEDAIPMFRRLRALADEKGLIFGLKLSNTLEVENHRPTFPDDEMMYMSGRALHAVTVNLALKLSSEFDGDLLLSFAGGADAYNVSDLMRSGMATITVCSDLLKTGGYLRFPQYIEELEAAMDKADASTLAEFSSDALDELRIYATEVRKEWRYKKHSFRTHQSKTDRKLGLFDCIEAPCVDECPVSQDVPAYMRAVREGRMDDAVEITRKDNPVSAILGRVCDHLCETTCIRTHLDQPLAIRDMKRFIMSHEANPTLPKLKERTGERVAVIGAGPAGIAAARDLAAAGIAVTVFEAHGYPGGMVGGAIPEYRLPQHEIDKDMAVLAELGVEVRYNQTAGEDFSLEDLRRDGFDRIFVAVGAQLPKYLGVEGEDADGVLDALTFLRSVREHEPVAIGSRVGVIGAGDTAMDCARSAWRVGADEVSIIYRRSTDQMPADPEEVHGCLEEGIAIVEMTTPQGLRVEDGTLKALVATRTEYQGDRDASGRKIPHDVPDSEHEIPLDTLILAISQHSMLDFFGDDVPEVTSRGYIAVDPSTLESSVPGVYAGGDVAADGPSSIVKAAADGHQVAEAIVASIRGKSEAEAVVLEPVDDLQDLVIRRARREYRVPTKFTPLELRDNFDETALVFTTEEAQQEASRCVDCDTICSLCVGVCPNIAIMTYETDTFATELPEYAVTADGLKQSGTTSFRIDQPYQIAVLTDFCNECGNCATACPTSGKPYLDKPRLYLDRHEFDGEEHNAFMISDDGDVVTVLGRFDGATHELSINGDIEYRSPSVSAVFDDSFNVASATVADGVASTVSFEAAATMYTLWRGLATSMPEIPTVDTSGTWIPAPMLGA